MSATDERTEPTTRPGETVQPPAGFLPSMRHYLGNRTARTVIIIAVVVVAVLAIALALSLGSTSSDEPGPGASGPASVLVQAVAPVRAG